MTILGRKQKTEKLDISGESLPGLTLYLQKFSILLSRETHTPEEGRDKRTSAREDGETYEIEVQLQSNKESDIQDFCSLRKQEND